MSTDDHVAKTSESLSKWGADDALFLHPDMNPWDGEITHDELFTARRTADVIREAEKIRVREDARSLVTAQRAGGVSGLPEPVTLAQSLLIPSEYPEKWRIEGMLPYGGNASLTAVRKVGKTVTSTNMIRSLVDGEPFLERFEVSPVSGTVAISNYEVSREQLDQWLNEQSISGTDRIVQFPFRGHRVPLMTDEGTEWMAKRLKDSGCEVWIVDPFSAAYNAAGGMQENDNSEVRRFLERLNEIKREAGVSEIVLTVHGSRGMNEGSERSRAASSLEDWPDALWQLNKGEFDSRYFKVAAGRDVTEGEYRLGRNPFNNRLYVDGGSRSDSRTQLAADSIAEYLRENPGAIKKKLEKTVADDYDHSRDSIRKALASMVNDGRVNVESGEHGARKHFLSEQTSPPGVS